MEGEYFLGFNAKNEMNFSGKNTLVKAKSFPPNLVAIKNCNPKACPSFSAPSFGFEFVMGKGLDGMKDGFEFNSEVKMEYENLK